MTAKRGDGQALGSMLVIASTLFFSLTGVLTKAIRADAWTIVCWRGLIGGIAVAVYVVVLHRRRTGGRPLADTFRLGWRGWLLATVGALSSIAFIVAFKLTFVANVAVIYATAPFLAAGFGWWLMRETVRERTLWAAGLSLLGVTVVVAGGLGSFSLMGDLMAVAMTAGCALYMVLIRRFPGVPAVWAGGASAFQLFVLGWLMTDPLDVSGQDAALLTLFGLSFAAALILWTEGTRLIPAAQSGLLGTAETPFATLLAWILLAELPPATSLVGGALVLAVVLAHAGADVLPLRRRVA